ncbi:MAG: NAD-binding protein [bacterium]|nr:NAD-binding protein [bacterium]
MPQIVRLGGILVGIILIGVVGYTLIEGWPLDDSLYMTIISLTTVGYGEIHPLSRTGRMFTAFLLMLGVGSVFYVMASIAENMIEGRVRQIFGRRKRVRELENIHNHHIVCGYGKIGNIISHEFEREGKPFVVIENNPEKAASLNEEGILVVQGDATKDQTLIQAGIERANGLIGSMPTDAENVYVTLSARRLNPNLFIVARADDDNAIPILKDAGANRVVSPNMMGGHRMAESLLRPKLASFFDAIAGYTSKDWDFEETTVLDGSKLVGLPIRESQIGQETGVYVIAVRRAGTMIFNPGANFIIQSGDTLFAMGRPEQIESLKKNYLQETQDP